MAVSLLHRPLRALLHRSKHRVSVATKLETSPMDTGLTGYRVATAEVATGYLVRQIARLAAYRDAYQCDAHRQPAHGCNQSSDRFAINRALTSGA